MSYYSDYTKRHADAASSVPFAHLVAPMNVAGQAVYDAVSGVAHLAVRAVAFAAFKAKQRSTVRALSELDDRTLADIGIRRSEIDVVARHAVRYPSIDFRSLVL